MIASWIIDHIPLWAWITLIAAGVGALLFYAGPVVLPIWRMLPGPVRVVLVGLGAAGLAFLGGRYRGRSDADEEQRRRDAEALQKRTEVDRDVGKMSGSDVDKKLRDRWSRD